uniref:Uncharacterized protein n=1 Tax=Gopherus agassizii TaxID=38772 RepID=A0A452I2S3_9SAUR
MKRCGGPALWGHLPCGRSELRLELVLRCGQAFRWLHACLALADLPLPQSVVSRDCRFLAR